MPELHESVRIDFTPTDSLRDIHPYPLETGIISYLTAIEDPAHSHHDESARYVESIAADGTLVLFGVERSIPEGYEAIEWNKAVDDLREGIVSHLAINGLHKNVDFLEAGTVPSNPPVRDYERK